MFRHTESIKETSEMTRMPGRASQPWCPHCQSLPGPDCPDRSRSPRQVRQQLKRDLHREIAEATANQGDE